jgi:transcriptional regulatory protein LevR
LKAASHAQLLELCLRLVRAKKENKELLTYLLYEADDLPAYINTVKKEVEDSFAEINTGHLHWVKKSLRKIVRQLNKHIRYTGSKTAEVELRIHFCTLLKRSNIPFTKSTALTNLFHSQIKKAEAALKGMHEDLQRDYDMQLDGLK